MAEAARTRVPVPRAQVPRDLRGEGTPVLLWESDYSDSIELPDHLSVIERGVVQERTVATDRRPPTHDEGHP